MNIYRYVPASNDFSSVAAKKRDWPLLDKFTGSPLTAIWKPLELKWDDTAGRRGDFPSLRGPVPVFSPRAWDVLSPLINFQVEALPASAEGERLYVINVLDVRESLDQSRSKFKRFSSGRVMYVAKYRFAEERLQSAMIWKVPETASLEVLVSEEFKSLVEKHELLGLQFENISVSDRFNLGVKGEKKGTS